MPNRNSSFGRLNVIKRTTHTQYSELPVHEPRSSQSRDYDEEKHGHYYETDEESDYSDYSSTPSSRDTSGSYSPQKPMLKSKQNFRQRPPVYKLPSKVVRYLCLALISTVFLFMLGLIRMGINSSSGVTNSGNKPPPPPPLWESFEFLSRYYGGLRTLVPFADNVPEYPGLEDEPPQPNATASAASTPARDILTSQPFDAFNNQTTTEYLSKYETVHECFLDMESTIRIPQLQFFSGRPSGFPENVMGSYELIGLEEDICFERYGRLGPYGYGYAVKHGGTGTGAHGDAENSDAVWTIGENPVAGQVDYTKVDWAAAQQRCYKANANRFEPKSPLVEPIKTFSVIGRGESHLSGRTLNETYIPSIKDEKLDNVSPKEHLPRTAVVLRSWDTFNYREEDILHIRAMISELSLASGGEYDVHLLVEVKDEAKNAIWADDEEYQRHLNESVPEEFRGIATLWSQTQMLMVYQGIFDTFARGPELPVHGSYRGLQMALQWFSQKHLEYDFFWHWEMDIRYTGHYYDLFSKVDSWTKKQPRKGLWERNGRFYVPSVHGTWEDFKQMVRVQTDMGTDSPNNVWSKLDKSGAELKKGERPIWGPERPQDSNDWLEDVDIIPPTSYEKDKYVWGVGEEADLITFNPIFDPEGTNWLLAQDITGYNTSEGLPPRRAAIVSSSRMSRRLLDTMHRETAFKKHHAFSEMWAPTAALHHGHKAVYVPHPMYVDREWPTEYLTAIMNAGRNGATGGARTSVFGEREHNMLGMTWYYNAGFAPNLWKRWLGLKVNNEGGEEFETIVNEGRSGVGVNGMKGGEGRMCLPPMLLHPIKAVELPVEGEDFDEEGIEVPESDPSA